MRGRVFPKNRVYILDTDYQPLKFHRERPEGEDPVYPAWPASACGLPLTAPWAFSTAVVLRRNLAERIAEPCKKCFPSVQTSEQTGGDRGGVGSVNVGEGSTPPSAPTEVRR